MDTKSSGILGVCLIIAALIVVLVPRPQMGRYQMRGVPGHAYVIDTATGKTAKTLKLLNMGHDKLGLSLHTGFESKMAARQLVMTRDGKFVIGGFPVSTYGGESYYQPDRKSVV